MSSPFAFENLDRLIHEPARLSIVSSLAANPQGLIFTDLKRLCALTDGNLSRQIQTLQQAKVVDVWKGYANNRPQTLVRLTGEGRGRFLAYVAALQDVITSTTAQSTRIAQPVLPEPG